MSVSKSKIYIKGYHFLISFSIYFYLCWFQSFCAVWKGPLTYVDLHSLIVGSVYMYIKGF